MTGRDTDRGAWILVTRREFWVRLRDRGFLISTAITLTVLSVFILANAAVGDRRPQFRLAVVGAEGLSFGQRAVDVADVGGVELTIVPAESDTQAQQLVHQGVAEGAVLGEQLVTESKPPGQLEAVVQEALRRDLVREQLSAQGLTQSQIDEALDAQPQVPRSLVTDEAQQAQREINSSVALVAVILLYGQLFGYGVWVASGVVEEKSTRVVEVLLGAIRARHLMAGKVVGIGLLGLLQLTFIGGTAVAISLLAGSLKVPGEAIWTVFVALAWFAMGFAFYASLFAVAGSLVSRMEELQNAIVPLNLLILGSFFVSIAAANDPTSAVARIASIVPFSSALAMPPRIALGAATVGEVLVSIGLLVGATAVAIPLAGRLYAGAILRIGARVKLRDAWRATR
jgi:ABC-2 type transport system permease protein